MLSPVLRLLYLWLCSEAVACHLNWDKTKTTFSPYNKYTITKRNAQSRRWRTVSEEDRGGTGGASTEVPWLAALNSSSTELLEEKINRSSERNGDAQNETQSVLRTEVHNTDESRNDVHEPTCAPGMIGHKRRQRRVAESGGTEHIEPLPVAMAQELEAETPSRRNNSDYVDEDSPPDFPDPTAFVPVNPRTRRKQLRNPFYPVTAKSYGAYVVLITAVLIFSMGIIGNVSIMCIVCHNYYMRSISNSLLASLALWDFVIIFFCLPLVVFHELTKKWLLGEFSCRIIPYLEVVSLGITTFTLCALCIDRFRAATNVQIYEMIENWTSTTAKLAVIWVGALLLALPELLIKQLVTEDDEPPDLALCERCVVRISTDLPDTLYILGLTYNGARLWWYFGCYFCLPTLFTICSSLATVRKIRRAEQACVRGTKKQIQLESQMNCAVVALTILYGFCIIPENICNIISVYMAASIPKRTLDILYLVSQLLLFCKSAVTPVLLFCLCQPFTRAFLDCCCCCCDECGPTHSPTTAASNIESECATTDLELSPFSTTRREASTSASYTAVGTHY